jgi:hypothetical protein
MNNSVICPFPKDLMSCTKVIFETERIDLLPENPYRVHTGRLIAILSDGYVIIVDTTFANYKLRRLAFHNVEIVP